jgi:hypothetical protein
MSLAFDAYQAGRAAAETYRLEGRPVAPSLDPRVPPYSLAQVLLKDPDGMAPTPGDVATVAAEWTRGVRNVWEGER